MEFIKIAIFQMDSVWEHSLWNLDKVKCWVEGQDDDVDICLLPEMFATGFSMNPTTIAQTMDGEIVSFMRELAQHTSKALIFSAAISAPSRHSTELHYFNRLFFIAPDGTILTYDKRHLFRMAGEHNHYSEGQQPLIVHYKGWRIAPFICYDLRFPAWSRVAKDADILIYIASWPEARQYAWSTLLKARAIENQCFTVGVNRCGDDPKNHYSGDSVILDFMGHEIVAATPNLECSVTAKLELAKLQEFRAAFPAAMDADKFQFSE